jgi:mono/diheme cytochrome c family protein
MAAWLINPSFAAGKANVGATPIATITVTLGQPSENALKLSKTKVPVGTVVFDVVNRGKKQHNFKVCGRATASRSANACVGQATPTLKPGKSATLKVVFKATGSYEFLSGVAGQAQAGMKGLLVVGQATTTTKTSTTPAATTAAATTAAATTSTSSTTTKPPATEALIGNPANGATVFASAGCASCHTLAAAGATGTVGPNLDQLAPDQATVVTQVTNGGFSMPSFSSSLSASQINDLASYVYQSTHA